MTTMLLMMLQQLNRDTMLTAANGKSHRALDVFAHALRYFRQHALEELSDQTSTSLLDDDVRWVITVPAIWKPPARQFMRLAAVQVMSLINTDESSAQSGPVKSERLYEIIVRSY